MKNRKVRFRLTLIVFPKYNHNFYTMIGRDELTGAFNRNTFFSELEKSIDVILLNRTKLILLCANIDNMKHFNMHNGYLAGDEMLKYFVSRATSLLGNQQSLFRYQLKESASQ